MKYSMFKYAALVVAATMMLGACSANNGASTESGPTPAEAKKARLAEMFSGPPMEQAMAQVSDMTSLTFMPGHGNQIEYNAADGSSYLWYPGNKVVLKAQWKITNENDSRRICYLYGDNTYNPQTKTGGGKWECQIFHNHTVFEVDRKQGDVFGLSKTTAVPHVLEPGAVLPYIPGTLPVQIPYTTNGKTPIEHLQEDFAKKKQ